MPEIRYWSGSAPTKHDNQQIEEYGHIKVNVFKLKTITKSSSVGSHQVKDFGKNDQDNNIDLQRKLLREIASFSYLQLEDTENRVCSGYSLRIICKASNQNSKKLIEAYLIGRVAGNEYGVTEKASQSQFNYIKGLLKSNSYQFEIEEQNQFDSCPAWLTSSSSPNCYEVLKPEEIFLWLEEEDRKYFYSPSSFQVYNRTKNTKPANLIDLLMASESFSEDVCVDIVIVPTKIEEYEKKTISKYIEALNKAEKGSSTEDIVPDSNAQKAKLAYKNIQEKYYSDIIFLSSFRVFSKCSSVCQSVASQLATSSIESGNTKIVRVADIDYAVRTLREININERACTSDIWQVNSDAQQGFMGGPVTLKRLHRIVDLDEASAFFRLPIPIEEFEDSSINVETLDPTIGNFPMNLDIEAVTIKYEDLVTENTYVVGVNQEGNPSISDFSKIPHRIVAGTTGAGKTNFLTSFIYQFLYVNSKIRVARSIYVADFKGGLDYHQIEMKYKSSVKLITKIEDLATLLKRLYSEYERRINLMKAEDVVSIKELREKCNSHEHRIVLIIDEAASILSAERSVQKEIEKYLRELAAKSRVTDINIFYCTQTPTSEVIDKQISDNIDERVIFRVSSSASNRLVGDDMASKLPIEPKGRAVYRGSSTDLQIVATPFVPKSVWNSSALADIPADSHLIMVDELTDRPVEMFPSKLDITDIINNYEHLITEDTYVVGVTQDGSPTVSDFSKIPHRIIAGTTGAGKTNFLTSFIYQFLYINSKIKVDRSIYIADFKGGLDYYQIEARYSSVKLITEAEHLATLLKQLYDEYERRIGLMRAEGVDTIKELREKSSFQEHRIVLIIDEAASILSAERSVQKEIEKYLRELAAKSRVTDINIFYCTQKPTAEVIDRQISDNIDERVIFRVSSFASNMLIGDDIASKLPIEPKGRAVYRGSATDLQIIVTPFVPKSIWKI